MLKRFEDFVQRNLSKSPAVIKFVLLLRNQCNMIIQYYLTKYPDGDANGEHMFIDNIAAHCFSVIDVGANKGEWTDYFTGTNPAAKALLLEPSSQAYGFLLKKFQDKPNITCLNLAASNTEGETFFYEESEFGETSSLISSFSSGNATKTLVGLTTIDALFRQHQIDHIDYLKIDAEGFDYLVMQGASQTLSQKNIKYLQFEYNAPWAQAGSTLSGAFSFLTSFGYKTYLLRFDGLYELDYNRYGEYFRYSNFISTPLENLHAIQHLVRGTI